MPALRGATADLLVRAGAGGCGGVARTARTF